MAAGDEEKKPVTQAELKAGVRLTAGHRVVLIVEGAVGATTTEAPGEPESTEPPETTTAVPESTTTAQPSTTTTEAPEETTTEPDTTTTTSPSTSTTTSTPTSTTTEEPSSTTTGEPSSTTTGPGTTTTKAPGAQVVVELHADVLTALPDGALVLSGDGVDEQQVTFADAEQADGVLRFTFKWDDISKKAKLVANGGSKSVTLWDDQAAGDPSQELVWSGAISDLYTPSADQDPGEPQSVGDGMPDNLHLRDDEVDQ